MNLDLDYDFEKEDEDLKNDDLTQVQDISKNKNTDNKNNVALKDMEFYNNLNEELTDNEGLSVQKENDLSLQNKDDKIKNDEKESLDLDESTNDIDNTYFSLDRESEKNSGKDIDVEKAIKNKIGVNVSFEEVAKAIRTKLKED